jgi:UDP:flavonoid glycosyltransferase YjiC (YdhE family)
MSPVIAVFSTQAPSHFRLVLPVIAGLAGRGADVRVFTHARFEPEVARAGATLVDVFTRFPQEAADETSTPIGTRFVSHAGCFARAVAEEAQRHRPSLVVGETFSVLGRAVATLLGLPWINVSAGHDLDGERIVRQMQTDPRVKLAPECLRAVEALRPILPDASPFAYVTPMSSVLNIYPEPPAFLDLEQRRKFEPLAFFGSLLPVDEVPAAEGRSRYFAGDGRLKLYVCFGTIVWYPFEAHALSALKVISGFAAGRPDIDALVSLGTDRIGAEDRAALAAPNVRVVEYLDQWAALAEADAFITHHGLNSTHEAIFHRVPMLSYPFFWDQPALADRCRQLGIAAPLADTPRGPLDDARIAATLEALLGDRALPSRLQAARQLELDVIAGREAVLDRILALAEGDRTPVLDGVV